MWKTWGVCLLYTINICLSFPNNMHTYENHGGEQRRNSIFQCVMCKACRLNGLNFRFEKFNLPRDSCSKVPWLNSDLPFHEVSILNTVRYIWILWTRLKYIQCLISVLHARKINHNVFRKYKISMLSSVPNVFVLVLFYHELWFDWFFPSLICSCSLTSVYSAAFWDPLGWKELSSVSY